MTIVRENKPVMYSDWHRHWYRVADFVQTVWHRFADSRTGRLAIWFVSRVLWATVKVLGWLMVAAVVVGAGVTFMVLSMALGNGKLMNSGRRPGR